MLGGESYGVDDYLLAGVAGEDGRMTMLIDIEKLLSDPETALL